MTYTFATAVDATNVTKRNCDAYYASDGNIYLISASRSDVKGENSIINIYKYDNTKLTLSTTLTNTSFNT